MIRLGCKIPALHKERKYKNFPRVPTTGAWCNQSNAGTTLSRIPLNPISVYIPYLRVRDISSIAPIPPEPVSCAALELSFPRATSVYIRLNTSFRYGRSDFAYKAPKNRFSKWSRLVNRSISSEQLIAWRLELANGKRQLSTSRCIWKSAK